MTVLTEVHRRYNPLRRSWVLCSPHRTKRPWQGDEETIADDKPAYDPKCYLCPGNTRANGSENPQYEHTYIFPNDFMAVTPNNSGEPLNDGLFRADPVVGRCFVVCFSPKHNVTLANMAVPDIVKVIDAWKEIYQTAIDDPQVKYCQIFENKGSTMGCSNPHPHGQAWLTSVIPDEPQLEHEALLEYHQKTGRHMLEDYVKEELAKKERIIDENDSFVSLVPFWATWPFETMVVSKRRIPSLHDLTEKEQKDLASILSLLTIRYDNLFRTSFPYSMGIHQKFVGGQEPDVEHLLFHFYPPLLRSATVKKFLVGFEMMGMPQRDITPELAAQTILKQSTTHYSSK